MTVLIIIFFYSGQRIHFICSVYVQSGFCPLFDFVIQYWRVNTYTCNEMVLVIKILPQVLRVVLKVFWSVVCIMLYRNKQG